MNRAEAYPHKVLDVRDVTPSVFVIRMARNGLLFKTGQHINVGPADAGYTREYSIYSGEDDPFLEVLIKEVVPHGFVSPLLRQVKPDDEVMVEPPMGYFSLPDELDSTMLFIATGTGISPYHSFIRSYPKLDYRLVHGVHDISDVCDLASYDRPKVHICTSQSHEGDFAGRVTQWLMQNDLTAYRHAFLCGNRNMINEARDILSAKGFSSSQIHAEAYF
ncbi:ferredoxin--NADP reductase [Geofilum sp. OHC36d9]|uniref:ferredoxin--NADP reductase n=1 Tax=Geofilum sp. OHC36d9 TaxID=3458413 RepID=UPI0040336EDA